MTLFQNKRGQTFLLLSIIVAVIVVGVFFAGWMYMFNTMTQTLQAVKIDNNIVNFSSAVANTVAPVNNAMSGLNAISMAIILGLIIASFIEAYFVRKHPIMFVVHLFIVAMAVTASIYISNEYEKLMTNGILGSYLTANTALSFIALELPIIVTVVGFVGLILLFAAINRDSDTNRGGI